jgi:CHASE2 domain-containing sensor protein
MTGGLLKVGAGASRPVPLRILLRFALACALTFAGDQLLHHSVETSGETHNGLTESLFGLASVYHWIVTSSPRKAVPRFASLIVLGPQASPAGVSLFNVCQERRFLAALLETVAKAKPNVIVIDKYFGRSTCPADDPSTQALVRAARYLCQQHIALVTGRRVADGPLHDPAFRAPYPLDPALRLSDCQIEGVLNIDADLRRSNLWWASVEPLDGSGPPPPSLALASALAASPNLLRAGRLKDWTPSSPPPYVSFVDPGQFAASTIAGRDAVCVSASAPGWRACSDEELSPRVRETLHARVVVIGEDVPGIDRHRTVVGEVPGYILQANYIESFLDDRIIRPTGDAVNWLFGLLIYALFEFLLWHHHHNRLRALLSVVGLFGSAMVVVYLAVALCGYYLNPVTVSVLAMCVRLMDVTFMPQHPVLEA